MGRSKVTVSLKGGGMIFYEEKGQFNLTYENGAWFLQLDETFVGMFNADCVEYITINSKE